MKLAYLILASSALVASPALAQTPPAAAATITPDQIAVLQAQIQALQTQVNQLQAAQATGAAQAATAAAAPKPSAAGWTSDTRISGKAYFNVSSIDNERDGVNQAANGTQTELKRFYVGIDHRFNDVLSANITTDFRYGSNGATNDVLVYVKKAYLQAKFGPGFFVRVGSADLPWVPFAEGIYGYRFVENELIDRTKFGTSADWGVHVGGSFLDGKVSYAASAINGAGYKTLSRNSNTIDLEGRISANPIKNVTLAVGGYTGKLGKSADGGVDTRRATRFNALAAYTDSRLRAGVEYFHANNWFNVTGPARDSADGWSAFGSYAFTRQFSVFGRYDWVRPRKDASPDLRDHYFNVGVNYKPIKELDLALVYKRDRARNGFLSTSNGTIGGIDNLTGGTYNEFGLFGQFVF